MRIVRKRGPADKEIPPKPLLELVSFPIAETMSECQIEPRKQEKGLAVASGGGERRIGRVTITVYRGSHMDSQADLRVMSAHKILKNYAEIPEFCG